MQTILRDFSVAPSIYTGGGIVILIADILNMFLDSPQRCN